MIGLLCFGLAILISLFRSKSRLEAKNAVLRHQLIILRRKMRGRPQLTNNDRWFFIQLALASGRLSPLLAMEVALSGRAATDRDRAARADPADERREPALGSATHPAACRKSNPDILMV
jgi:hypothetical protein